MKKPRAFHGVVGDVTMALILLSVFSLNLSFIRISITQSNDLWFLIWNLLLAWIPLVFAWALYTNTGPSGLQWSKRNVVYFIAWILFLPNALYIVTDFVHLEGVFDEPERLFDIVLLASYTIVGVIVGLLAVLLVHIRVVQRFGQRGHWLPVVALLLSGFAIYMGRYLRWNSWDVFINPFALLFDVSDRIVNPANHAITFTTTLIFFSFYGLLYLLVWRLYALATSQRTET